MYNIPGSVAIAGDVKRVESFLEMPDALTHFMDFRVELLSISKDEPSTFA